MPIHSCCTSMRRWLRKSDALLASVPRQRSQQKGRLEQSLVIPVTWIMPDLLVERRWLALDRSIGFIQLNALRVKIASIAERSDAARAQKGLIYWEHLFSGEVGHPW